MAGGAVVAERRIHRTQEPQQLTIRQGGRMKRKEFITVVVAVAGAMFVGVGVAQVSQRDVAQAQSRGQLPEGERIDESDLMTRRNATSTARA
jgi:predicted RNA-binding protein with PUA domain